jgi:hypothetical protein
VLGTEGYSDIFGGRGKATIFIAEARAIEMQIIVVWRWLGQMWAALVEGGLCIQGAWLESLILLSRVSLPSLQMIWRVRAWELVWCAETILDCTWPPGPAFRGSPYLSYLRLVQQHHPHSSVLPGASVDVRVCICGRCVVSVPCCEKADVCGVRVSKKKGRIHGSSRACIERGGEGAHSWRLLRWATARSTICEGTTGTGCSSSLSSLHREAASLSPEAGGF